MSVSVPHGAETHKHPEFGFLRKYIFSEDHKIIGIQFLFSGIIFLFIGGGLALLVRTQLGWPQVLRAALAAHHRSFRFFPKGSNAFPVPTNWPALFSV